ncbi:hypothetical protein D3C77_657880 [compost metagenome]
MGDAGALLMLNNGLAQVDHALLQRSLLGAGRQAADQALQNISKFQLLTVFPIVHDLARLHRCRIVGADVADQVQRFGGIIDRVSQQRGTAQSQ